MLFHECAAAEFLTLQSANSSLAQKIESLFKITEA